MSVTVRDVQAELLGGPRGRRFCMELAEAARPELRNLWLTGAWARPLDPEPLAEALGRSGPLVPAAAPMAAALRRAVETAAYWQPPHDDDLVLLDDGVLAGLEPVAAAAAPAIVGSWWSGALDPESQRLIQWVDDREVPGPDLSDPAAKLARWTSRTRDQEREAASWPRDPSAPFSGPWWSVPALVGLPETTRQPAGAGPVALANLEDSLGWREALAWPLRQTGTVRAYEIGSPRDWAALVERYPLEVPLSRRHDWWRFTGEDSRWAIPDWEAVARDHDAVHLTVLGYLTTAGLPLDAGPNRTVLAGWSPDTTYWLGPVLAQTGDPVRWARDSDDLWSPEP